LIQTQQLQPGVNYFMNIETVRLDDTATLLLLIIITITVTVIILCLSPMIFLGNTA